MVQAVLQAARDSAAAGRGVEQEGMGGAEYERLLAAVAPVLPWQGCLAAMWQWYEEPSVYGVQVATAEWSRSSCPVMAHYAPSLSAVQLFARHPSGPRLLFEFVETCPPQLRLPLLSK